ncbi:hypothetical protein E0H39_25650 [Rhizobium leguminosarum bv. viciae]|nr:hypothetical protein E0H39_25650 [Rhizobium leguminosarum bv. viciae]
MAVLNTARSLNTMTLRGNKTLLGGEFALSPTNAESSLESRPEISVYWIPGCSSCVKVKEFISEHGLAFESLNVLERPEAMEEVTRAGLRGVPAVRRANTYAYAQSLDDVAALLGVANKHTKLSCDVLFSRWDDILEKTRAIVAAFDADVLQRPVIPQRDRTIRELCVHTFQVAESFLRQVADDTIDARAIYLDPRPDIQTRADMLSYVDDVRCEYRNTFIPANSSAKPDYLNTHYGQQPFAQVLERGLWHTAQHARQLDHVAAGIGFELQIPQALYLGLPIPNRLWS